MRRMSREHSQTCSASDLVPELQAKIRDLEHGIDKRGNTIEILNKRIEQLETYLRIYGSHLHECQLFHEMGVLSTLPVCTCGLEAARKGE